MIKDFLKSFFNIFLVLSLLIFLFAEPFVRESKDYILKYYPENPYLPIYHVLTFIFIISFLITLACKNLISKERQKKVDNWEMTLIIPLISLYPLNDLTKYAFEIEFLTYPLILTNISIVFTLVFSFKYLRPKLLHERVLKKLKKFKTTEQEVNEKIISIFMKIQDYKNKKDLVNLEKILDPHLFTSWKFSLDRLNKRSETHLLENINISEIKYLTLSSTEKEIKSIEVRIKGSFTKKILVNDSLKTTTTEDISERWRLSFKDQGVTILESDI